MRDWEALVRERFEPSRLRPKDREEIAAELAGHLEDIDIFDDALARGLTEAEAIEFALQSAGDWRVLAEGIQRAKRERKQSMNNRIRSLWLPGLASLAAANLFLLLLTRISLQPQFLVRLNAGLGRSLYLLWLFAQLLFGALGAFLSRRAGGTRTARIVAGMFPAIVMFGLWALVIPVSALAERNEFVLHHPLYYSLGILVWVVPPGMALLLGTAPFLQEPKLA